MSVENSSSSKTDTLLSAEIAADGKLLSCSLPPERLRGALHRRGLRRLRLTIRPQLGSERRPDTLLGPPSLDFLPHSLRLSMTDCQLVDDGVCLHYEILD